MRWIPLRLLLLGIVGAVVLAGCRHGSKAEEQARHSEAISEPAPTPDTTPVEALRTPAGLTLKAVESAVTPTPAPK
jgi:hypothetical protein